MKRKTRESKALGVRLPITWIDSLEKIAIAEERTLNGVIRVAIRDFLIKKGEST